ncbi:Muramidase-2 precursor [Enhygromyxa salina]|uniref:Muramidase-2 n=1 Tax=Enhygromyxa salina TaxID=215803 RepID=A0A2S9YCI1_9BACT|nr:penicillin-insensitive murein endopeptidase [Enhygromyxa salina]PRQ02838.1 Muramidase-2 precursor [Enhygromyxa salina]
MRVRLGLIAGFLVGLAAPLVAPSFVSAGGCPDGGEMIEHEVAPGQTLSGIAVKHGVSQRSIERANPRLDPNKIRSGQKLKVCLPGKSSNSKKKKSSSSSGKSCGGGKIITEHEVRSGDTLSGIAAKYGVSVDTVVARNAKLKKNPNSLRVGQELLICLETKKAKNSKTCGYRTPLHTHVVVPGENLGEIAGRYGVRRRDMIRLNSKLKSNANLLSVGQRLRVCPEIAPRDRSKIEYTVKSGDTLGGIASKYGLTTHELLGYQRGKLKNANDLKVGQTLVVYKDGSVLPGFGGYDDDTGVLSSGVQMPSGKYYVVKHPNLAYGTGDSIRLIQTAISAYRRVWRSSPKIHIGDISKKGGGKFPPHRSHQHGRDVDIGYVLKGDKADEVRFVKANASNLDVNRTWDLIDAFLDTNEVKYIFMDYSIQKLLYEHAKKKGVSRDTLDELFQYPRGKKRGHGIIRHSSGHVNHFHVRFRK